MKKLGFGMMRLPINGDDYSNINKEESKKMIDKYMQEGFCYFDTAYFYHKGSSEPTFGELVALRYPRDSFVVTTKMPIFNLNTIEEYETTFNDQIIEIGYLLVSHNSNMVNQFQQIGQGKCDYIKPQNSIQGLEFLNEAQTLIHVIKEVIKILPTIKCDYLVFSSEKLKSLFQRYFTIQYKCLMRKDIEHAIVEETLHFKVENTEQQFEYATNIIKQSILTRCKLHEHVPNDCILNKLERIVTVLNYYRENMYYIQENCPFKIILSKKQQKSKKPKQRKKIVTLKIGNKKYSIDKNVQSIESLKNKGIQPINASNIQQEYQKQQTQMVIQNNQQIQISYTEENEKVEQENTNNQSSSYITQDEDLFDNLEFTEEDVTMNTSDRSSVDETTEDDSCIEFICNVCEEGVDAYHLKTTRCGHQLCYQCYRNHFERNQETICPVCHQPLQLTDIYKLV